MGRKAAVGPPSIAKTAHRHAAPAVDGGVLLGQKGLLDAAAPPSVTLDVGEGSPSRV